MFAQGYTKLLCVVNNSEHKPFPTEKNPVCGTAIEVCIVERAATVAELRTRSLTWTKQISRPKEAFTHSTPPPPRGPRQRHTSAVMSVTDGIESDLSAPVAVRSYETRRTKTVTSVVAK